MRFLDCFCFRERECTDSLFPSSEDTKRVFHYQEDEVQNQLRMQYEPRGLSRLGYMKQSVCGDIKMIKSMWCEGKYKCLIFVYKRHRSLNFYSTSGRGQVSIYKIINTRFSCISNILSIQWITFARRNEKILNELK